jgi:tRNA A-37 threonylcarbamoyl transferase component Bud32
MTELVGRTLANYTILDAIGQGGMATVYRARDLRDDSIVAIKVLSPYVAADPKFRGRFDREVNLLRRLAHPNIVPILAFGQADGYHYIVMPYFAGGTLHDRLRAGPLLPLEGARIVEQISSALDFAHQQGIIHRDVKPSNILLGENGEAKLTDFGFAHVPWESASLTGSLLIGTPAYMSPEQVDGKDVDFRSDLFSFGVLLYELAAGTHPFEAPTPLSTAARVLAAEPPVLWEQNPAVPHELDRIVRKCMRKEPSERYQSTADLVVDLESLQRVTDGQRAPTLELKPAPRPKRSLSSPRAWWQIHQFGVMLVYTAMLIPAWQAREITGGTLGVIPFVIFVVGAVFNGILRVHMLFTAAFNTTVFAAEFKRAGPWIQRSDCLIGAVLVVSALPNAATHTTLSSILAGFGIGVTIISLMIEPATTRAAFPRRISGTGRRTPVRK